MKPHRSFTTMCLQKELITPSVYELHFEKPAGFSFQPGQFVLFDVPLPEDAQDIQPRAYSIASAPFEDELRFIIKLVPNGRASRWVDQKLAVGTSIRMKGPFGAFTLDTETAKSYLFVATGTGVAPLRSQIIQALRERKETRPMHLAFGTLRREDLFWVEMWMKLEREHPNFHAHFSTLHDKDEGIRSVQELVAQLTTEPSSVSVYICGTTEMVNEVKDLCFTLGIVKKDIHAESYI